MTADPQPQAAAPADPIIGIDLGTTNSLVAHCTEAGPAILESPEGERSLPSVVRLLTTPKPGPERSEDPDPSPYTLDALGHTARAHAVEHPTTTLHSVKRLMGRSVQDVISDLPYLPYAVVEGPHATARIALPTDNQAEPVTVTPQEVSAMILRELKRWADAGLGTDVRKAVITVPAYFDDAQRQATRDAGRLAGLQVMRIVNEPTAAALAYGLGMKGPRGQGAKGTSEKNSLLKPRAAERSDKAPDPPPTTISLNTKLNPEACSADPAHSAPEPPSPSAPAPSQTVAIYDLGGGTFDVSILRLQPTEHGTIDQVLATDGDTHLGGDDFDHTLIQLIQDEIRQQANLPDLEFPPTTQQAFRTLAEQTKVRLSTEDSAEIQIDLGEAFPDGYQRSVTRDEFESLIEPHLQRSLDACRRAIKNAKLTVDDIDRVILVGGSTRVPRVRQKVAELFQTTPYTALNPDEVVALGASVQAAVLAGVHRDTLLLDVIPLSLGIETMGGAVAKLIVANSAIPARATEMFSTYAEGQTNVKIHVLQGERELVQDCRSLATFDLTGIPPMPAGLPKINVTFLVDANGILSVQAVEERSGRRAQVQVVPNHGLTRDEISQIEADSFTFARQDMNAHRLIDLRLNAKLDIRNIRKQLDRFDGESENGSAIDPDYRALIEKHLETVEAFIAAPDEENDADAFQKALHELDHATIRLAELNIARTLKDSQKPG